MYCKRAKNIVNRDPRLPDEFPVYIRPDAPDETWEYISDEELDSWQRFAEENLKPLPTDPLEFITTDGTKIRAQVPIETSGELRSVGEDAGTVISDASSPPVLYKLAIVDGALTLVRVTASPEKSKDEKRQLVLEKVRNIKTKRQKSIDDIRQKAVKANSVKELRELIENLLERVEALEEQINAS